jgi:hypothetical protein
MRACWSSLMVRVGSIVMGLLLGVGDAAHGGAEEGPASPVGKVTDPLSDDQGRACGLSRQDDVL